MHAVAWSVIRAGTVAAAAILFFGLAGVWAAPGPGPISYRGGGQGSVIFDHGLHAARGMVCVDCHTDYAGSGQQLFATHKQALIDRASHDRDASCFACHNGSKAFNTCETCHRRP